MPEPVTVVLSSKRQQRAQTVQRLNHLIPAFGLLLAGQQAVAEGGHDFGFYLGVLELVSSAMLIILTARELKAVVRPGPHAHAPHEHRGIDWVDIAAGLMLVVEAVEHWHAKHHLSRPTVLTAITTLALGLFHGHIVSRVAKRRIVRVSDDGLLVAGHPFKGRRIDARWDDLESIDLGDRWAVITTRRGQRRRLDIPDVHHAPALREALRLAQERLAAHRTATPINTAE